MIGSSFQRGTSLFFLLLLITWPYAPVIAEELEVCAAPTVYAKIIKDDGQYELVFEVANKSSTKVVLEPFYFDENLLNLKAVRSDDGRVLRRAIPLLTPGVGKLILAPGKKYLRKVSLNGYLPDLKTVISKSDVRVTWSLSLRGDMSCFAQTIDASMVIPRN